MLKPITSDIGHGPEHLTPLKGIQTHDAHSEFTWDRQKHREVPRIVKIHVDTQVIILYMIISNTPYNVQVPNISSRRDSKSRGLAALNRDTASAFTTDNVLAESEDSEDSEEAPPQRSRRLASALRSRAISVNFWTASGSSRKSDISWLNKKKEKWWEMLR